MLQVLKYDPPFYSCSSGSSFLSLIPHILAEFELAVKSAHLSFANPPQSSVKHPVRLQRITSLQPYQKANKLGRQVMDETQMLNYCPAWPETKYARQSSNGLEGSCLITCKIWLSKPQQMLITVSLFIRVLWTLIELVLSFWFLPGEFETLVPTSYVIKIPML